MALQVECGSFSSPAGTGNQTVTLADGTLTPTLVILSGVVNAGASVRAMAMGLGAATSTTSRWAVGIASEDNVAAVNCGRSQNTDEVVSIPGASGASPTREADFVSFGAGQFVINWTTAVSGTNNFNYIAIGGSGVSVKAGMFASGTSATNVAVTGVGFVPKLVLFATSRADTTEGETVHLHIGLGAMEDGGAECSNCWFETDASDPSAEATYFNSGKCLSAINATAVVMEADFVSMDSDGFTINLSTAPVASRNIHYIAIGGDVQSDVGTFTQSTNVAVDTVVSGRGFQPSLLGVSSPGQATASGSVDTASNGTMSIGATSALAARWGFLAGADDNVATTVNYRTGYLDQICLDSSGTTPTEHARADIASFDSGGFTLDWDTVDATARNWWYWMIGPTAAPGGTTTEYYYRRRRAA